MLRISRRTKARSLPATADAALRHGETKRQFLTGGRLCPVEPALGTAGAIA